MESQWARFHHADKYDMLVNVGALQILWGRVSCCFPQGSMR